ncbi:hypothetical protein AB1Y20_013918 [Prymnesium parvum]|uniref:Protein-tyrosine sulfotransferase n=1 Tax=Prymnesium parvum TaxID=97485 RepID=A0AB34IEC2_PRYPA
MTARTVTHLVGLAVAMANYEPRRLLVVTGFPRSGTTLIETFLAKHGGILPIYNLGETTFREYEPYGSVHEYGGSLNCLTGMCGSDGYVSWADDDKARYNCWSYIERAKHIKHRCAADGACGGREFDDKWLPMAKHPALIVLVEELHRSCARVGVEITFLVTVRNPLNWGHGGDIDYSCTGDCRHEIVENWVRCVGRLKAALHLPNVMAVRYEDMGQEQTWRQIERLLGLDAIPITILPGKHVPGGRRELVEGQSAVQEAGQHRRLVIEGGHSDASSSFVILLGYIEEQCSGCARRMPSGTAASGASVAAVAAVYNTFDVPERLLLKHW